MSNLHDEIDSKREGAGENQVRIHCKYDKLIPIKELKAIFNPDNPNEHGQDQIDELIKQFKYQGIRDAAKISNRSKLLTVGHGRIMAAEKMGLETYPVVYQDYENFDQEYSHMVADNSLNRWSFLNLGNINAKIEELGPDFDIDLLGIKDFSLDPPIFEPGTEDEQGKLDEKKPVQCPNCGEQFVPKS